MLIGCPIAIMCFPARKITAEQSIVYPLSAYFAINFPVWLGFVFIVRQSDMAKSNDGVFKYLGSYDTT